MHDPGRGPHHAPPKHLGRAHAGAGGARGRWVGGWVGVVEGGGGACPTRACHNSHAVGTRRAACGWLGGCWWGGWGQHAYLPDALVPHANAKYGEASWAQRLHNLKRDAAVLGPAWGGGRAGGRVVACGWVWGAGGRAGLRVSQLPASCHYHPSTRPPTRLPAHTPAHPHLGLGRRGCREGSSHESPPRSWRRLGRPRDHTPGPPGTVGGGAGAHDCVRGWVPGGAGGGAVGGSRRRLSRPSAQTHTRRTRTQHPAPGTDCR